MNARIQIDMSKKCCMKEKEGRSKNARQSKKDIEEAKEKTEEKRQRIK